MLKLKVPEMTCGHCAATIEKAVTSVDPTARVQVDLSEKTVTIQATEQDEKISEVVRSAGYDNEKLAA